MKNAQTYNLFGFQVSQQALVIATVLAWISILAVAVGFYVIG